MNDRFKNRLSAIIRKNQEEILQQWMSTQLDALSNQRSKLREEELKDQCSQFLELFQNATRTQLSDIRSAEWAPLLELLAKISRSRGLQGFTPSETAAFIFSFKSPLFAKLQQEMVEPRELAQESIFASELLDKLGLYTMEVYHKSREEVISRQHQELLELSTPVIKLWEGVLALPLIGTLDSARTQVVMESLLQRIVETGSDIAIIDITGVPTVDTLVAQHLIKTATAAKLMGADCIISGIRPQIAQTIVHLGVDLGDITTKANLADAFGIALQRRGLTVCSSSKIQTS